MRSLRSAARLAAPLAFVFAASGAAPALELPSAPLSAPLSAPAFAPPLADSLDRYGFSRAAFEVDTLVVPQDVSLYSVFVAEGVSLDGADRLVTALDRLADQRVRPVTETVETRGRRGRRIVETRTRLLPDPAVTLDAGEALYVYRDSANVAHFVFEPSVRQYFVLSPGGLVALHEVTRPEVRAERVVQAVVQPGGVARTLRAEGVPETLADSLAAIFQHRFGLGSVRRGDSLALVYPEARVDTAVTDTGAVLAVRLGSGSRARYAFRYTGKDGRTDYYDEAGRNWRNQFLASPVKGAFVSSPFSMARLHPVLEIVKPHLGTDFSAPEGTPILALADGTVMEAQFAGGNGNYVRVQHDLAYTTAYLHMSRIADGMKPGLRVQQGDTLGFVGMTGLATGPHTCLRFYRHGAQVDFQRQPSAPAAAVPPAERARFAEVRARALRRLNAPPGPFGVGDADLLAALR